MMLSIKPIGVVHSSLKKMEDCPLQAGEGAPEATIEIFDEYGDAASHIKPGEHLVLLTWLDKANRMVLKTHPRNDSKIELMGIFSTRSPDRPNPIGIHTVKVLAEDGKNKFKVSALEVLDGTPVVDIKSIL
jgi:tRNA-Thr(GGU) m(6)t(6)A37 methyltransferase TsaA